MQKRKSKGKNCLKYWFLQHIQKSSKSVPSYFLNNFSSCYPSLDQRYPGEDIKENFLDRGMGIESRTSCVRWATRRSRVKGTWQWNQPVTRPRRPGKTRFLELARTDLPRDNNRGQVSLRMANELEERRKGSTTCVVNDMTQLLAFQKLRSAMMIRPKAGYTT